MKNTKPCLLVLTVLLLIIPGIGNAQNLSFGTPKNTISTATTGRAPAIAHFKENFFIGWTDITSGKIHIANAGPHPLTGIKSHSHSIEGAHSNFAPTLISTATHLYFFWISTDGKIAYVINSGDSGFSGSKINTLGEAGAALGLSCAVAGNKLIIASHNQKKDGLIYTVAAIGADGLLTNSEFKSLPFKSADCPAVIALADTALQLAWRGNKDQDIYFANGDITAGKWGKQKKLNEIQGGAAPSVFIEPNSNLFFYVTRGAKKDNKLYYTAYESGNRNLTTQLPPYFNAQSGVSVTTAGKSKFVMAYTGVDNKIYLAGFDDYNPAKWMEQTLFPGKANYSLKDIIMPGSHDAGMSVLTATGGQQKGTINDCNTLTQIQNVKAQLNSGLRMFDIRTGLYKDSIYTKHASSDCMDEAIGGGFGEKFSTILHDLKVFLKTNNKETVILSFSHFCAKETPMPKVAQVIIDSLGKDLIYANGGKKLGDVTLNELAGKAIITFEEFATPDKLVDSCTIANTSNSFMNFKRLYAATNNLDNLKLKEKAFFAGMSSPLKSNDLVRLDWQLTQGHDEAAMVCNSFQDEGLNPLFNGVLALTSAVRNHHSIIDLSKIGNQAVLISLNGWINDKTINKNNKPNILYVDVAGTWVTDYCVQLNSREVYTK